MLKFLLISFFCFFFLNSFTQDTVLIKKWDVKKAGIPDKKQAGINYFFRKFDMEQGLDDPYVLRIRERKNGEILYGTAGNGAGIFDGVNFKIFNTSNGLKSNVVQDLFEDNNGNLWFATSGGGICMFNGINFKYFDKKNGLKDDSFWTIFQDKKNNLWFGSEHCGVYCYDGKNFINYSKKDGLCSNNIRKIFQDKNGNLWFGSNNEGLSIFDYKKFTNYNESNGLTFNSILGFDQDSKGKIWIASYGGGLMSFYNNKFSYFGKAQGLLNLSLCDVLCDKKDNVWIATSGNGMFMYDGKVFTQFSTLQGLTNNVVLSLLEDKYSNIWCSTYGGGICQYTAKQFTYYSEFEGLPSNLVRAIVVNKDSTFWFATSGGGLCFYDNKNFITYNTKNGLTSNYVLAATNDKDNNLWFATSGGGISKHCNNSFFNLNSKNGLKTDYFLSLISTKQNKIIAGSYGYGLFIIDGNKIINYNKKHGLDAININSLVEDNSNNIWIGTDNGLFVLKNGKIKKIKPDVFNKNVQILTLYCDNNNKIYIGTEGYGLFILSNNKLQNFNEKSGICNNHVKSIIIEKNKNIWLGTSNGLSCLIPISQNADVTDYKIENYNRAEGYTGSSCLTNSIAIDKKNNIWIGTGRKLLCINLHDKYYNNIPPVINITNIKLFFSEINWNKSKQNNELNYNNISDKNLLPENLILPYNKNHLTFEFNGINQNCPEKTSYSYKLFGLDKQWSPKTYTKEAIYSNIPYGKYTFKVIAYNENGVSSVNSSEFSFEITPPWWKENWFKALIIVLIVITCFIFIKYRERKLIKAKIILENTVKERTAEIVKQRDEILVKNITLNQQKEEITAQRDEIESQRDEIIAQRDLVTSQKDQIEYIHDEISKSIDYATRLQTAILPDLQIINKYFSSSFVIFNPKDKVSGDFYWLAEIENQLVITVADCTGHGVPGAFMSMLGSSLLREIVIKEYITKPAIILKRLRKEIINILKQKGISGEQKDGMDISLIAINTETFECQWAGANNPLYVIGRSETSKQSIAEIASLIVRNDDVELCELKGDKMPIAIHERMDAYTNHEFTVKKGDCLYLFSDGFADQFGGPNGKKFMYKPFKQMLQTIYTKNMEEQKQIIEKTVTDWIGAGEQIDDITILGIKI